jgi:serpin B
VSSDLERDTDPQVPAADLQELAAGNSQFALELYQALRGEEGNLFFSPYSISVALAMTYAGARGETEAEMAETLSFTLPQLRLHPAFNRLGLELESRGEAPQNAELGDPFRLNIANALWGQEGYPFLPEFLDTLAANYGAGMRLVDFAANVEAARVAINDWVSDKTEGKIEDLIPAGLLSSATRLVLTNAIYFNAAWATPFPEGATQDGTFYLLDGGQVTVPMMRLNEGLRYVHEKGFQVIDLPYNGHELSMVIVMPDEGGFESFEGALDAATLQAAIDGLGFEQLDLRMPRFEFEDEFSLGRALAAMGMPLAFSDDADFSGMNGNQELFISAVVHKAYVGVDEEGTEAAAATAVVMAEKAMAPSEPIEVTLDRPFLFFIRDIPTNTILFAGRVMDPSS